MHEQFPEHLVGVPVVVPGCWCAHSGQLVEWFCGLMGRVPAQVGEYVHVDAVDSAVAGVCSQAQ